MTGPLAGATRHLIIKWQLLGVAFALAVLGLGYLAWAIDLYLVERLAAPAAAAITAGLLILTALAVVGVTALVSARRPKAVPPAADSTGADLADLATTLISLSRDLNVDLRSSAKPLTIAALVVGCVVGYSPTLRRTLKDLIK